MGRGWLDRFHKQDSAGADHAKEHLNKVMEAPGCVEQGKGQRGDCGRLEGPGKNVEGTWEEGKGAGYISTHPEIFAILVKSKAIPAS